MSSLESFKSKVSDGSEDPARTEGSSLALPLRHSKKAPAQSSREKPQPSEPNQDRVQLYSPLGLQRYLEKLRELQHPNGTFCHPRGPDFRSRADSTQAPSISHTRQDPTPLIGSSERPPPGRHAASPPGKTAEENQGAPSVNSQIHSQKHHGRPPTGHS